MAPRATPQLVICAGCKKPYAGRVTENDTVIVATDDGTCSDCGAETFISVDD